MLDGETKAEAGLMESVLKNGYFAAFSATGPCCIFRVVAERGQTLHRILVAKPGEPYVEAHRFAGVTASSQSLVFRPEEPLQGIAFVRVVTDASPSSVAWREIVIESTPPP